MQFPFHNSASNMRPTANSMLTLNHVSSAEWNESRFNHERFDKILVESRGVTDVAKRKEMFCEMLDEVRLVKSPLEIETLMVTENGLEVMSKLPRTLVVV